MLVLFISISFFYLLFTAAFAPNCDSSSSSAMSRAVCGITLPCHKVMMHQQTNGKAKQAWQGKFQSLAHRKSAERLALSRPVYNPFLWPTAAAAAAVIIISEAFCFTFAHLLVWPGLAWPGSHSADDTLPPLGCSLCFLLKSLFVIAESLCRKCQAK